MSAVTLVELPSPEVLRYARTILDLRSTQVNFVRKLADRDDINFSQALGLVIDCHAPTAPGPSVPVYAVRKHVSLQERHLITLDRLAGRWGLSRSEVARRLIDEARKG